MNSFFAEVLKTYVVFAGGAADKTGVLKVGDEILSVNSTDCTRMSRIEAWNFMKKLSDGTANIIVRQKLPEKNASNGTSASKSAAPTPSAASAAGAASPSTSGKLLHAGGEASDTAAKLDRTVEETKHI